ncbi:MAG: type II secretion system protein [Candidatus Omnitrophota bacterium]
MRKSAGFTLIELITVVVVIGILVTIALPNYARSVERSRCTFALNNLKAMRSAAIIYFRETQTFTGMTLAGMETLAGANFYSDNSLPEWRFIINSVAANTFVLRANRLKGPHMGDYIELTYDDKLTGSTYPYENPGQF